MNDLEAWISAHPLLALIAWPLVSASLVSAAHWLDVETRWPWLRRFVLALRSSGLDVPGLLRSVARGPRPASLAAMAETMRRVDAEAEAAAARTGPESPGPGTEDT